MFWKDQADLDDQNARTAAEVGLRFPRLDGPPTEAELIAAASRRRDKER